MCSATTLAAVAFTADRERQRWFDIAGVDIAKILQEARLQEADGKKPGVFHA